MDAETNVEELLRPPSVVLLLGSDREKGNQIVGGTRTTRRSRACRMASESSQGSKSEGELRAVPSGVRAGPHPRASTVTVAVRREVAVERNQREPRQRPPFSNEPREGQARRALGAPGGRSQAVCKSGARSPVSLRPLNNFSVE